MFVMAKKLISCLRLLQIEYLLVLDVSSMIVVLNAKFALLLAAHANKKCDENRRSPTTVPFFAS